MESRHMLCAINVLLVVVAFLGLTLGLIHRDHSIHTTAFEMGYEQVQKDSSLMTLWGKVRNDY